MSFTAKIRRDDPFCSADQREIYPMCRRIAGAAEHCSLAGWRAESGYLVYHFTTWAKARAMQHWIDRSGIAHRPMPDSNDFKFIANDPWGAPSAYLEYLERAVEVLLEEGRRGEPKMLNVGLHIRIIGRPGRFWALQKFMDRLKRLGDRVWIARRIDIARHWLTHHPPSAPA